MAKINATDLLVYVGNDAIAHSQEATLTVSADLPDASTKDSAGWAEHIHGQKSWSISVSGLVDYTSSYGNEAIYDALTNGTSLTVKFSTETSGHYYWQGSARFNSYEQSAPNEAPLAYSAELTGTGALTLMQTA